MVSFLSCCFVEHTGLDYFVQTLELKRLDVEVLVFRQSGHLSVILPYYDKCIHCWFNSMCVKASKLSVAVLECKE